MAIRSIVVTNHSVTRGRLAAISNMIKKNGADRIHSYCTGNVGCHFVTSRSLQSEDPTLSMPSSRAPNYNSTENPKPAWLKLMQMYMERFLFTFADLLKPCVRKVYSCDQQLDPHPVHVLGSMEEAERKACTHSKDKFV